MDRADPARGDQRVHPGPESLPRRRDAGGRLGARIADDQEEHRRPPFVVRPKLQTNCYDSRKRDTSMRMCRHAVNLLGGMTHRPKKSPGRNPGASNREASRLGDEGVIDPFSSHSGRKTGGRPAVSVEITIWSVCRSCQQQKPDAAMSPLHDPCRAARAGAGLLQLGQAGEQEIAEHRNAFRVPQLLGIDEIHVHLRRLSAPAAPAPGPGSRSPCSRAARRCPRPDWIASSIACRLFTSSSARRGLPGRRPTSASQLMSVDRGHGGRRTGSADARPGPRPAAARRAVFR